MKPFDIYRKENPRLGIFFPTCLGMLLLLIVTLGWRQIIEAQRYHEQETRQAQRRILQPGPRGDIYDRNGRLLVGNRPRYSAVIFPDDLSNLRRDFRREYIRKVRAARMTQERTGKPVSIDRSELSWEARANVIRRHLDQVNQIIGREEHLSAGDLRRHFQQELLLPLSLVRDLEPDEYARLVEQLPVNSPVQVYTDSARFYPYGEAAAHVLGYVTSTHLQAEEGLPGERLTTFSFKGKVGRTGLERTFDEHLSGASGGEIYRVDPGGFQHELVESRQPTKGRDLVTSLDIDLQLVAEEAMAGKTGAVVAIRVSTGEVLVLASKPSFDLNQLSPFIPTSVYEEITERGAWLNRATQGLYPPGSTFKLITAMAGLRAGILEPDTLIDSPKYFRVGNRLFPCHSPAGFGEITLPRALAVSSNTFFYNIGVRTGIEKIAAEAKAFGLDTPLDLELPFNATRMIVPNMEWKRETGRGGWVPGDTANVSIGQGFLLTTPFHMASLVASLGRRETTTRPTLLRVNTAHPEEVELRHGGSPIGLAPGHLESIFEGMSLSINAGTGRLAQLPYLQVGGKTGTSQVRKDGEDLTLAWFVGMAPMEQPDIAICVMIEGTDRGDNYHGGSTAAPIARAVIDAYFRSRLPLVSQTGD